jgi:hypothetical protein
MGFFFQGFSHLNPTQKIEKLTAFCKFVFAAGDTLGKVYIVTYSNGNEKKTPGQLIYHNDGGVYSNYKWEKYY